MRLIYAEELKAALKNFVYLTEVSQHSDLVEGENIAFKKALELLDNAPTVEAEPVRHAKWLPIYYDNQPMICACSLCDRRVINKYDLPRYCPTCGAKMEAKND
jgi:hypothetical protein